MIYTADNPNPNHPKTIRESYWQREMKDAARRLRATETAYAARLHSHPDETIEENAAWRREEMPREVQEILAA